MKPRLRNLSLVFTAVIPLTFGGMTLAATVTYDADTATTAAQDGAGAGWNTTNANFWNGTADVVWPNTAADEAIFGAGSGAAGSVAVTTVTANKITFNTPGSGNYTLTGSTITLGGASPTITANANASIGSALAGTAGLTKTGTSTLTLSGANTCTGGLNVNQGTLTYTGGASVVNSGGASGGGNVQIASGATLNLSGPNNNQLEAYGTWTIGGTLAVTSNKAHSMRATSVILNDGTMTSSGGSVATFGAFYAYLANTTITANGTGNLISGNGDIGIANAITLTLATPLAGDALTVSTAVKNGNNGTTGGVAKTGAGTVTLTAANTYAGTTSVNGGTLVVDGSLANSAVAVNATGTLAGTGSVKSATVSGTVSPGGSAIGTLTVNNAVTFNSGSNTVCQIDRTATQTADQLYVTSAAILQYGGTLTVTNTGDTLQLEDTFQLFNAAPGSYAGSFSSYDLPTLPAGLNWDTSSLTEDGSIKVVNYAPTPVFTPAAGGYAGAQTITMNSGAGTTIYYTYSTNGTEPADPTTASVSGTPGSGTASFNMPDNSVLWIKAMATNPGSFDSQVASATYGTITTPSWIQPLGGDWTVTDNWQAGISPNGANNVANFSSLDLTADTTVNLDQARTIGSMTFGDTPNPSHNWILASSTAAALTLDVNSGTPSIAINNQTTTISAALAGSKGLAKSGAGTLVLTGANTYTGSNSINAGTLQLGNGVVNGTINGTYNIGSNGTLRLARTTQTSVAANSITGAGTLSLGVGSYQWDTFTTFDSGFTGKLVVEKGRISFNSTQLGGTSAIEIQSGAQFLATTATYTTPIKIAGAGWGEGGYESGLRSAASTTATWSGPVTLTADSGIRAQRGANFTITGPITGNFACTFAAGDPQGNSGTLTIAPASPVQNSYASTVINGTSAGSIVADNPYAFSTGGLTMTQGTLKLNGNSFSFANLAGTGGTIGNYHATNEATLTIGGDNSSTSSSTPIINGGAAALALAKTGAGTLTLTGASTYSGGTTINNGILLANNTTGSATGTGSVTVKNTATFGGTGAVSSAVTLEPGGTLAPGASVGTLATGALTLPAGATLAAEINSSGTPTTDSVTVTGDVTLGGALTVADIAGTPAALTLGTKLTLINYGGGALTGTFTGKPEDSTFPVGGNTFRIRYADAGKVTLEAVSAGAGYSGWAATNAPSQSAGQDYDNDGVSNGVEWVLGGLATTNDAAKLPTVSTTTSPGNLTFTFKRDQASKTAGTGVFIQVGTTLAAWTTYPVPDSGTLGPVEVTDNEDGTDTVKLTVTREPDTKKFARLNVVIAP